MSKQTKGVFLLETELVEKKEKRTCNPCNNTLRSRLPDTGQGTPPGSRCYQCSNIHCQILIPLKYHTSIYKGKYLSKYIFFYISKYVYIFISSCYLPWHFTNLWFLSGLGQFFPTTDDNAILTKIEIKASFSNIANIYF